MAVVQGQIKTPTGDDSTNNPDLVISLREENSRYVWRIRPSSSKLPRLWRYLEDEDEKLKPFYTDPSNFQSPKSLIQDTYRIINRAVSDDISDPRIIDELQRFGRLLYDRLFPNDIKDIYWEYLYTDEKPRDLNIVIKSSEPWIPWEIVRPYSRTNRREDLFLCEKFNLSRWLPNVVLQDIINLSQVKIFASSALPNSQLETESIVRVLGMDCESIAATTTEVDRILHDGNFTGLHFICHGWHNTKDSDYSELRLDDGCLRPIDIGGANTFLHEKTLIFINACETGQSDYALTGFGGWADAFLRRCESSCFIGSMWKADDLLASKFAPSIYDYLKKGKPIAKAVRLTRDYLKQEYPYNPTWLTYTVYANPLARALTGEDF